MLRPLGQFPDWADHATGTAYPGPGVGFTPGTQDPGLANLAIRQHVRDWAIVRDAYEVANWGPSNSIPGQIALGPDCFSYDPVRRLWFFGGQHTVDHALGFLNYSYDGINWAQVVSSLPLHHGTDTNAYYQQAVADDGRYFTWLHSDTGGIGGEYAYFNLNAGLAGWTASANQPSPKVIYHAFWAQEDNRFLVCSFHVAGSVVYSVDVDADTWDVLELTGNLGEALPFGTSGPPGRIVATADQLWYTTTVASAFRLVTDKPWTGGLKLLRWCPGPQVFIAITDSAVYSSPNGVVWSTVYAPKFGLDRVLFSSATSLGDIVVVAGQATGPDAIKSDLLYIGTNALRDWQSIQSPQALSSGLAAVFGLYSVGDGLVTVNNGSPVGIRRSMRV